MIKTTCTALTMALALAGASQAALIHANGNATLISGTTFASGVIANASDGNSTVTTNGQLYTNDPGGYPSDYFAFAPAIVFDLDLGSVQTLDSIAFWNRGFFNNNSVQTFSAEFSLNSTFGEIGDTSTGPFTAANGVGGDQQDFAIGTVSAQFVRITISDNYFDDGNPGAGGDRTAFTEFQFNAVPEPSSTALLGLGGLALILRRRK